MIEFNIEKYLDSLPDDVDTIDVSSKNLNYLPNLSRFKKLEKLYCGNNNLTSLPVLPEKLERLYCYENNLISLPILPENLERLYCEYNQLTSLPVLPKNLKELYCHNNELMSLPVLPEKLKDLFCYNNKLTSLPILPEYLTWLYCHDNKLRSLPTINKPLTWLSYHNNPIHGIINDISITYEHYFNFNKINKKMAIWNNFRYLYYCLKYRKRFLKIMEPIIKKRYHPSYLDDLKEEDDLDEKLGAW